MADPMPEPPVGAHVLIGEPPLQVLVIRDDTSAAALRRTGLGLPEEFRWWPADGDDGDPISWLHIVGPDPDPTMDGLPRELDRKVMVRLFTQAELDQAVADAGVTPVGKHLKEPGGYCRTCSIHHSETEWARIHDQLAEEDGHAG